MIKFPSNSHGDRDLVRLIGGRRGLPNQHSQLDKPKSCQILGQDLLLLVDKCRTQEGSLPHCQVRMLSKYLPLSPEVWSASPQEPVEEGAEVKAPGSFSVAVIDLCPDL